MLKDENPILQNIYKIQAKQFYELLLFFLINLHEIKK